MKYNHSETKLFVSNKSEETIRDLKPGTTYNIGVLIIMDDGTLNQKHIVFGQYNTICLGM